MLPIHIAPVSRALLSVAPVRSASSMCSFSRFASDRSAPARTARSRTAPERSAPLRSAPEKSRSFRSRPFRSRPLKFSPVKDSPRDERSATISRVRAEGCSTSSSAVCGRTSCFFAASITGVRSSGSIPIFGMSAPSIPMNPAISGSCIIAGSSIPSSLNSLICSAFALSLRPGRFFASIPAFSSAPDSCS